jgi:isopropylmalate/homocitrate/citramalate synthase
MAVATSIAGAKGVIDGGQDAYINTTINGIGERCGNADLVATILAITKSKGSVKNTSWGIISTFQRPIKLPSLPAMPSMYPFLSISRVSAPMLLHMNPASMPTAC